MTYVGKKVKEARKRAGLTQSELATHSGVSVSTIRKLEQGDRDGARMETLHALARTLRLSTMDLVAEPHEEGPQPGTSELWLPVRAAVMAPPARDDVDAATPEGVAAVLEEGISLYREHQFVELAAVLPALLRDADTLAYDGREVRARVLRLAAGALTHTRQFDIAELVAKRAVEEAQDRLGASASVNTLAWLLMRQGRLGEAQTLATQWADDMEPRISRATSGELAAWGLMLVRASGAAARNNHKDVATDMLRFARTAATAIGREVCPEHENARTFGPTTMRMWTVENELIRDRPDAALRLSEGLPIFSVRPTKSVRNRHELDIARAHARLGQFVEAFDKLSQVRKASPQWFPNQTFARDTLQAVIAGRRTLTPEMREMADALRLSL
ncbi:helix-turn-helix transcriptional regulator [Streptomyces sp. HSW2009]|uniref:helix-turn-helix domain-containing protein n=1 Tax=Streptomyces sp. HSW2009 TaxID=3142890 RepID=UPI0032F00B2B